MRDILSSCMSEEIFQVDWIEVENQSVDQKRWHSFVRVSILILMKCSVCRQVTWGQTIIQVWGCDDILRDFYEDIRMYSEEYWPKAKPKCEQIRKKIQDQEEINT